jgi:hypothetical protein
MSFLPLPGTRLRVIERGPDCELRIDEIVTAHQSVFVDLLTGTVSALRVIRSNGEEVVLRPGPAGAILEEEK